MSVRPTMTIVISNDALGVILYCESVCTGELVYNRKFCCAWPCKDLLAPSLPMALHSEWSVLHTSPPSPTPTSVMGSSLVLFLVTTELPVDTCTVDAYSSPCWTQLIKKNC